MNRGGSISYYSPDGLGSIATLNTDTGTVQNNYVYDAWGVTRAQTAAVANPFAYTAREFGEAGLQYSRFRHLSPSIGRFVSDDPLNSVSAFAIAGGILRYPTVVPEYTYAINNPVRYADPFGLDAGGCPDYCLQCVNYCVGGYRNKLLGCYRDYWVETTICDLGLAACLIGKPVKLPFCFLYFLGCISIANRNEARCERGATTWYLDCLDRLCSHCRR